VWANLYSAATGINVDAAEIYEMTARGRDISKVLNIREGANRKDDRVPKRFLTDFVQAGKVTYPPLNMEYLERLITDYYEERGWDPQAGTLSPERMVELTRAGNA